MTTLTELRRLHEAATPAPWHLDVCYGYDDPDHGVHPMNNTR